MKNTLNNLFQMVCTRNTNQGHPGTWKVCWWNNAPLEKWGFEQTKETSLESNDFIKFKLALKC